MKRQDFIFLAVLVMIIGPFFVSDTLYQLFISLTAVHPYLMAYVKFFILATVGEMLGLRFKTGQYNYSGYGLLPRAIVWGVLGVAIAAAMKIFACGVPVTLESFGISGVVDAMQSGFTWEKLMGAFGISLMMNCIFAPIFMTVHKITDTHIINNGGKVSALLKTIPFGKIIVGLNWDVQWNFVFKKTIPLFWIPAHTITFMLPASFQVLFAASLSIVLGILLSVAAALSRQK